MNTSEPERRQFRYEELKGHLRQKKYPEGVIESAIKRASALDRMAILNAPPPTNDDSANNRVTKCRDHPLFQLLFTF